MNRAADNDILIKIVCYGLVGDAINVLEPKGNRLGVLAAARYVLKSRVERRSLSRSREAVTAEIDALFAATEVLEPDQSEAELAATIEAAALRSQLALDFGESQLCAIVIRRGLMELVSGDKRAIASLEQLSTELHDLTLLAGKVRCLEQLIAAVFALHPAETHSAICSEPHVDRALFYCFSCHGAGKGDPQAGLSSYIASLREAAPTLLAS